ncbi:hypothetical protein [Limnobacter litoralis]|uniref:Lipoprotein n=1 Tax=Limnobacter litoralis TaxID=481366 RepID=A0ABQ5YT87_9BURK|nr:hypothetical protein [Limnobacter litoralis]GLR27025.1 hypothetical protein GCM10007875_21160 [Limnobacter litoralis]
MFALNRLMLFLGVLPLLCSTSACTNLSGAAVKGVQAAFGAGQPNLQAAPLKPGYAYLEVHSPNAQALLPLIFEDKLPGQAPIDTWVSNDGQVLRTQAGFLASSSGLQNYWQNVHYQFNADGTPASVQFDLPSASLYGAKLNFVNLGPVTGTYTPLMQRAAKAPNIAFNVWQTQWANKPAHYNGPANLNKLQFIVGYNTSNYMPVYGLHCLQANYCVEYLLRTAAQNL